MKDGYELRLILERVPHASIWLSHDQASHVAIDMKRIESDDVRVDYRNRHVVIEFRDRVWARIPDVVFLELRRLADEGSGEWIDWDDRRV